MSLRNVLTLLQGRILSLANNQQKAGGKQNEQQDRVGILIRAFYLFRKIQIMFEIHMAPYWCGLYTRK
jgi:hypothetical protein